jgi:hypothetical protein
VLGDALQSQNVVIMIWTALTLGFVHSVLGPDHYVPFVMMARVERWSAPKTGVVTFLCGLGHVASSIVIGATLIALGTAASQWEGTFWGRLHEWRGAIAAWALMGIGAAYAVWGLRRANRGQVHAHVHTHDGEVHLHPHDHHAGHLHVHPAPGLAITPWVLFTIFVFGPCESLIPLMLAAWALGSWPAVIWVSAAFSLSTVLTIMATVGVLLAGLSRLPIGKLERYAHALAGLSLLLCGVAIEFLGL